MTKAFEIEAKSENLPPFRKKLRSLLEAAGFAEKPTHDILLSVDEVLTNVIRHAYGGKSPVSGDPKIQITVSEHADRVEVLVEDQGPCFDPRTMPAPKLPSTQPGGLGVYLVRTLMDEMDYEAVRPRGNRLRLVKYKKERKREP